MDTFGYHFMASKHIEAPTTSATTVKEMQNHGSNGCKLNSGCVVCLKITYPRTVLLKDKKATLPNALIAMAPTLLVTADAHGIHKIFRKQIAAREKPVKRS
ncbi:hypothetical protein AVEN_56070-1 [Araneus ventricosus]|uniref:Uncharacterized protein n=1 Tax=Araneus ventricosus TaxID=182803 RepID=A0A4Y2SD44_ARAVE|nr:hypothetical protein AVEN_56070-1 [Araneus ventricosus]